jgi:hypothetical protein
MPCKTCKGRCKLPKSGAPVWAIETAARSGKRGNQPVFFYDWACPDSLGYAPANYLVELWAQAQAGLPLPELSAAGRDAYAIINETIVAHRRLIYG